MAKKRRAKRQTRASDLRPGQSEHVPSYDYSRVSLKDSYARAAAVFDEVGRELMQEFGLNGVDVGRKLVDGYQTGVYSIRAYVSEKKDQPKEKALPENIHGVPVDVIQAEFAPAELQAPDRLGRNGTNLTGRMTALVTTPGLEHGEMLLTCAHVVAGGGATLSDRKQTLQQRVDVVNNGGTIVGATLTGEGINWRWSTLYDCALIAPVGDPSQFLPDMRSSRFRLLNPPTDLTSADVNVTIVKRPSPSSPTSAHEAHVRSIRSVLSETTGLMLEDHYLVEAVSGVFAAPGDSGSLVFSNDTTPIGMVRAVSTNTLSNTNLVVLTPIRRTMGILGITFA